MKKKFKKFIEIAVLAATVMAFVHGCNREIIDLKYRAVVKWPDGTCREVEIKNCKDLSVSGMIQITTKDGETWYIHSSNVILIKK